MFGLLKKKNGGAEAPEEQPATVVFESEAESEADSQFEADTQLEAGDTDEENPADKAVEDELAEEESVIADEDAMMAAFEAWLEDSINDADRREAAKSAMAKVRGAVLAGDYDDALFDVVAKGADYDRAVADAEETGEIRGRNMSIEELMEEPVDDGVPHPGANGGTRFHESGPSIFDVARDAW